MEKDRQKATGPLPVKGQRTDAAPSSDGDISAFLDAARKIAPQSGGAGRGRLLFALDATMSRQPTWDTACRLQADMFMEAGKLGGLDIQLIYFRGFGECRSSKWVTDAAALAELMTGIQVRGGHTQISKTLKHALREHGRQPVSAMIYIGDCVEEPIDDLCELAGQMGLRSIPAFIFQEGHDPYAAQAFQEMARLTGGAYGQFDAGAAAKLRALLSAVAVYAAGGHKALADYSRQKGGEAVKLITQLRS